MEHISGIVTEIREDAKDTRTVRFEISNSKKDRHGTVLNIEGWQLANYKLNPIVGYQHNVYGSFMRQPDPDFVIGSSLVGFHEPKPGQKTMIGDVKFEPPEINKLADKILQKVLFGTLRAASVGFIPVGKGAWGKNDEAPGGKNETYYYAGQELLEWSIVNIPSNPKAVKKSLEEQREEILEYIRYILGNDYNPEKVMGMTLEQIIKDSEHDVDFKVPEDQIKETLDHHMMKRQIDLLTLKLY